MKTKRLLTVLLTVALAVILLAVGVSAAEIVDSGTCGDNLTWVLDSDEVLTISGIGAMENYDDDWNDAPWRCWCEEELQKVVIESGVTSIGSYAFYECQNLTDITLPEGITIIGEYAFYDCRGLTSFTIPESASTLSDAAGSVGDYAFAKCRNLTSVTLSESMTSIGSSAFYECNKLASIKLPNNTISIGEDAFFCCYELSDINIPAGLTSIEKRVFYGCNSLPDIVLPNGVTSIGEDAFTNCESMTSITIPESVNSIGDSAFSDCESLVSISIPNGVTSIGADTFYRCRELTNVTIPEGVTSIGNNAFYLCDNLPSITLPKTLTSIGTGVFSQCTKLTDIVIPKSVTSIGHNAFSDCSSLTSIAIPEGVTSIEPEVFALCNGLRSITIPDSVTNIGMFAFSACSSLTDITIPEKATSIGNYAFNKCTNLQTITFKGNSPTIGENIFNEVTATVYYPANDDSWTEDVMQDYGGKLTWLVEGSGKPLAILQQPKNTYTKAGKTAKVTMEVQGSGLKYQWYIKNSGQKKYSKSAVTSATYSCKMNEKAKDRLAYCIITDAEGNRIKSKTVILREAVSITTQPKNTQAQSGKTIKVPIKASGDKLKYQWYFKNAGQSKFSKSSVTSATYSCNMSEKSQGRQIYCVVTDAYGKTAKSKTVTLGMTVSITQQPEGYFGTIGDSVKIPVTAKGEGLTYQWYLKNASGSKFSKSSNTTETYSCKLNENARGRQIYCVITDKYGNTAKSETVYIGMQLVITQQPEDVAAKIGATATVSFKAKGDGLTYTWYFKDKDDDGFKKTSTFTGNTYKIKMSDTRDSRQVYCIVTDAYGNQLSTETVVLYAE